MEKKRKEMWSEAGNKKRREQNADGREKKEEEKKRKDKYRQMDSLASVLVMPITKIMSITKMTVSE